MTEEAEKSMLGSNPTPMFASRDLASLYIISGKLKTRVMSPSDC